MRVLCSFKCKVNTELIKKVEIYTSKSDREEEAIAEAMANIGQKYTIPIMFVDRDYDDVGFIYCHPKDEHNLDDLCELDHPDTVEDMRDTLYYE